MAVQEILDKITARNDEVVGCIAMKEDRLYHNLDDFDVDCGKIADTMGDLLALSDMLDDMDEPVNTVLTEYDGNCLVAQRIDGNLLVAVADHLQRGGYKKLQVGLNLQGRFLSKALEEAAALPADVVPAAPTAQPKFEETPEPEGGGNAWSKMLKAVVAPVNTTADSQAAIDEAEANKGKTKKFYRGQVYYE